MSPRDDDGSGDRLTSGPTLRVVTGPTPPPATQRFTPGAIIAGRYRLVALLGKGGMGEVYRADDLTLDQPVALKFLNFQAFLSGGTAGSDARLAQFHNELRIARQVSHKNVVRLYDLGEADGRRFLTMEYVDGEDLASLLRRIGRIPEDKAIQMARQLCAGVSAAHERGVLHRDLKPANVMIDGDGHVRVTDFGIATATADAGAEIAGTPQYMAPELLAGRPASTKSDIYALGLILFEIFTGRRAYDAKSLADLKRLHETGTVTTPSSIVKDLDPAVERVILRCLEKDPERRPASALTIAAALPGGDPLAAALAAGETPSPELLVAAGESDAMPVGPALAMASAFLVVLLVSIGFLTRGSVVGRVPIRIARDALADRADQIIRKLGYSDTIADRGMGFGLDRDYLAWEQRTGPNDWWSRVRAGRPSPVTFWYRTSPRELVPSSPAGRVDSGDPPMTVSGMHQLILDAEGRLVEFHTVPPEVASTAAAPSPPWQTMFEAADLDPKAFAPVAPRWTPRDFADATAAWEGLMPGREDQRIRIEAASFRNRLVSFQIVWPWTQSARPEETRRSGVQRATDAISVGLWIVLNLGAVLMARHNLRLNRADRRGAARLAIGMTLASFAARLLAATPLTNPATEIMMQIMGGLAFAALTGGVTWVFYLSIEPYARRFWPDALLAWSRLLSGRLRDARVGRELLIGLSFGALSLVVVEIPKLLSLALGWRMPQFPFGNSLGVLAGMPALLSFWINVAIGGLQSALGVALIFLVIRLLLRRSGPALAVGFFVLLLVLNNGSAISGTWVDTFNAVAFTALITLVIHRFGLLAVATLLFVDNVVTDVPLTTDLSVWWSTPTVLSVALLIGLVCVAYSAARAGQPLFGGLIE
jgi:hypothetical protein